MKASEDFISRVTTMARDGITVILSGTQKGEVVLDYADDIYRLTQNDTSQTLPSQTLYRGALEGCKEAIVSLYEIAVA